MDVNDIVEILGKSDSYTAITAILGMEDARDRVKLFSETARHLYWEKKDLVNAIALGRAGITHALHSSEASNLKTDEFESLAKTMAYNLASYTWAGWNEEGIEIDNLARIYGREAAQLNLRLAIDLGKPDVAVSRAFWMVGAHELDEGDIETAGNMFKQAIDYAESAGESGDGDAKLCKAYLGLIHRLKTGDPSDWNDALSLFEGDEHEKFFIDQMVTAWNVYSEKRDQDKFRF